MIVSVGEFKNVMYEYQTTQISVGQNEMITTAIMAAESEVLSYLRELYDVKKILEATGAARDAFLIRMIQTVAKFHFIEVSNLETLYDQAHERYLGVIEYLKDVAANNVKLNLPLLKFSASTGIDSAGNPILSSFGSRTKFNYE